MSKEAIYHFNEADKIDSGTRTVCYRVENHVYKITDRLLTINRANRMLTEVTKDNDLVTKWIGDYVVPTNFEISKNRRGYFVVIKQPFVEGVSMREVLTEPKYKNSDNTKIADFLQRSLLFYRNTGQIPDLFGRPHPTGWYDLTTTPNVKVELLDNVLTPWLVDTGLTRLSKNRFTGPIHNKMLAQNVEKIILKLTTI